MQEFTDRVTTYLEQQPVKRVWLFGSYARGEQTPESDVDLLVEFDHSRPLGLLVYARMWRELKDLLGRDVDLVEYGTLRPLIAKNVEREKQLIYERKSA